MVYLALLDSSAPYQFVWLQPVTMSLLITVNGCLHDQVSRDDPASLPGLAPQSICTQKIINIIVLERLSLASALVYIAQGNVIEEVYYTILRTENVVHMCTCM